ncbi:bifunctional metallophosphatase/5'-nucleotidase [Desmospora activa]|uniref:bifunctional metallophosphatase/5'-nucleotidase n=1 Tax=Desmospora activa TaxID=500615 RepID=UPI00147597F1|nr:bifunctional UDP-sugar hydrolase/5'-nucleotidase [Desmospora activa]
MSRRTRVHLIHTNDIHSHFEVMPQIHRIVNDLKRECHDQGEACWILDIGDHMDRSAIETEGTGGMANRHVLETSGYDMMTLGNNELLTFSKQELNELFQDASFHVLAANVTDASGEEVDWIQQWILREQEGFCLAFIGVTIPFTEFYQLLGWTVEDPYHILARQVSRLRREADAVVVLSHLGYNHDRRLAAEIPGIDVIMGAHTHHLLEQPERVGDTWIAAAGKFGSHVGHLMLDWDQVSRRLSVSGRTIPVVNISPDKTVLRLIDEDRVKAEQRLSHPIIQLEHDLTIDWFGESSLGNLLADSLLSWVEAECALVNAGQILGNLYAGALTRGHIHQICPHPINPCTMTLPGEIIQKSLEESLLQDVQHKEIRGFGFRGKQLGTMNVAGLDIVYDPNGVPTERIREIRIGGQPLKSERLYRVATIDMFTFGIGYEEIQQGTDLRFYLPEFLRDVMAQHLTIPGVLERAQRRRWHPTG